MHFSTLAIASAAILTPAALANPLGAPGQMALADWLDARASAPSWTVSKFSFCHGDDGNYEYSFNIQGTGANSEPVFYATCLGNSGNVYLGCQANPSGGDENFNIFAKTKLVPASSGSTTKVPQLSIQTWSIPGGCKYINTGVYTVSDAACATKKGSKFDISPKQTNNCE